MFYTYIQCAAPTDDFETFQSNGVTTQDNIQYNNNHYLHVDKRKEDFGTAVTFDMWGNSIDVISRRIDLRKSVNWN